MVRIPVVKKFDCRTKALPSKNDKADKGPPLKITGQTKALL
jgi:hypothetical protein